MSEVLWPPDLCPSSQTWSGVGNTAVFTGPFSGASRTYSRPGSLMRCVITLPMMKGRNRARWAALLAALRDRGNRIWMPDFTSPDRGSFPVTELLTNNGFSDGTVGWTAQNSTLAVIDRVARTTYSAPDVTGNYGFFRSGISVTQYAPYALRGFLRPHPNRPGSHNGVYMDSASLSAAAEGMVTAVRVPLSATTGAVYPAVFAGAGSTEFGIAGDIGECHFSSLTRCIQVDNSPNKATHSDEIDNAAWTKAACSVTANSQYAPNGLQVADVITENSATSVHQFYQHPSRTSQAENLEVYGCFKRGTGTRDVRLDCGDGGSNYASCIFDLGAGTAGTPGITGTVTNARAFIVSLGYGWYYCSLICYAPASTSMFCDASLISSGSTSYAGDGSSSIYAWRVGCSRSAVPTNGGQTVASALASGTAQTGSGIYVKGLPASTSGLLLAGKMVQIGTQINRVVAALNSDAAGKGYLQCGNPWREATNDAPVIVNTPMCKMMLATDSYDIETGPGQFSPLTLELIEAID